MTVLQRLSFALVLLAAAAAAPSAQPAVCAGPLEQAAQRYLDQAYDDVEPLVLECVYAADATPDDLQDGYRLLALTFIKQDLLTDAQLTIVKILGVNYDYEPDPVSDPPFYVALVGAVKDQLHVGAGASTIPAARPGGTAPPTTPVAANEGPEPEPPPPPLLVDVNTATAAQLDTVPGIGPAIAGRIVEYRAQNGPFRTVDDLQAVRGIGARNILGMKPHLTVGAGARPLRTGGEASAEATTPPVIESASVGPLINLNTATAAELETLDGIGPTYAARIVEYRTTYGAFSNVDQLTLVRGIGARKLASIAHRLTVEER